MREVIEERDVVVVDLPLPANWRTTRLLFWLILSILEKNQAEEPIHGNKKAASGVSSKV